MSNPSAPRLLSATTATSASDSTRESRVCRVTRRGLIAISGTSSAISSAGTTNRGATSSCSGSAR